MNLRTFSLALALALVSQLSLADDKTTGKDVSKKVEDAGTAIGSYTVAQRDQAVKSARTALADVDARMRRLERKVDAGWDKMDAAARRKARATLSALHKERDELAEWYGGLKHGSAEAWGDVRGGFVKSYEALKESFAKAAKEY